MRALLIAFAVACCSTASAAALSFADRNNFTSPKAGQVFQRSGTTGTIVISGSVNDGGTAHNIEANVDGGTYTTIATAATTTFSGSLTGVAQGNHLVRVRWASSPQVYCDFPNVGIGDVFVIAGQSNAVGQGTQLRYYADHAGQLGGPNPPAQMFGGDYAWHGLADKVGYQSGWVDSVSDNTASGAIGSIWPLVVTKIIASINLPVAVIPCAKDSTGIAQWLPGGSHTDRSTLYGACVYRAQQVTSAVKGIFWWQGETDATTTCLAQATYQADLQTIADAFNTDLGGAVLVPVLLQQGSGMSCQSSINAAISAAHTADSSHIASPADFSNLAADDTYHLKSDPNTECAATGCATVPMWTAVKAAFSYP